MKERIRSFHCLASSTASVTNLIIFFPEVNYLSSVEIWVLLQCLQDLMSTAFRLPVPLKMATGFHPLRPSLAYIVHRISFENGRDLF